MSQEHPEDRPEDEVELTGVAKQLTEAVNRHSGAKDWQRDQLKRLTAGMAKPSAVPQAQPDVESPSETMAEMRRRMEAAEAEAIVAAVEAKQRKAEEAEEAEAKTAGDEPVTVTFSEDEVIGEDGVLSPKAPFDNARKFANKHYRKDGKLVMYSWAVEDKAVFWEWNGRVYRPVPIGDMKSKVWKFLDECQRRVGEGFERFRPEEKHVTGLIAALHGGIGLPGACDPPMRLSTGRKANDVMMFRNGLIEVRNGRGVPLSPDLWVHQDAGYDWNPEAECPGWLKFLESAFPGDSEAPDGIEELLGTTMAADLKFQKGGLLIGKTRSGKGTIIRIGEALVGSAAFCSVDLDTWMKGDYAEEVLIGKKMIAFADVRTKAPKWYGQNFDPGGVEFGSTQRLLKITSGDGITLKRKWKGPWTGVLEGLVWAASNKMVNFNDATLPDRFIKWWFDVSFKGREDPTLSERLIATELPGIAARCLRAYWRAKERKRLIQPKSGEHLAAAIAKESDPFTEFMLDTFIPDPEGSVQIGVAYRWFEEFCEREGHKELRGSIIRRHFQSAIKKVEGFEGVKNAPRPHGTHRCYSGLRRRPKDVDDD